MNFPQYPTNKGPNNFNYNKNRPQTPQHRPSYLNQKSQGGGSHFQHNQEQYYPHLNKSRASNNSSASGLSFLGQVDQNEMFSEDLIFLLKNEDRNINHFKEKIEKEKAKVQNDFDVFRNELEHIMDDLKGSMQAELDLAYKTFITKYKEMKAEVQDIRRMRKEILLQNANNYNTFEKNTAASNQDLIQEIEKDAENFRSYKIYGYLSELIKQKLEPVL